MSDINYHQTIWSNACFVLINEIQRARSVHDNWHAVASGFPPRDEAQLLVYVQSIIATMASFSDNCPVISEFTLFHPIFNGVCVANTILAGRFPVGQSPRCLCCAWH